MEKKNWEARVAETRQKLVDWRRTFEAEFTRLRKTCGRGLFRRLSPQDEAQVAAEAQKMAGTEILAELPGFFDELGDLYLGALPDLRGKIRAAVGASPELSDFLWQYAEEAPDHIRGKRDTDRLRHALIACSIDDRRVETGILNRLLARLWIAGRRAGIDSRAVFEEVARVSNPGAGGGGAFMQGYLLDFGDSPYFRTEVEPQLRAGAA